MVAALDAAVFRLGLPPPEAAAAAAALPSSPVPLPCCFCLRSSFFSFRLDASSAKRGEKNGIGLKWAVIREAWKTAASDGGGELSSGSKGAQLRS